jgi:biopolymer transport protein ExbB/TolQ/uncharacterized protein YukE
MNNYELLTKSPKDLGSDPIFWLSNDLWVRILLCFIILSFVFFVNLTRPQILDADTIDKFQMANIIEILIIFFIYFLVFWGIRKTIRFAAKIEIDNSIAIYIENKASDELDEIKSEKKNRINLDSLSNFIPFNDSIEICMVRLFQHIIKEAKDRKFDSSVNIMETYREEYYDDIFQLQNIQKYALQLGILGTFIGLILALNEIGHDMSIDQIKLFDALKISFGTSIAGLIASIIIGIFLIMFIRRKQKVFFQNMETSTVTMISLARNAKNTNDLNTESSEIGMYFEGLISRINDQSQYIEQQTSKIEEQNTKIENQTNGIQKGISKLSKAKLDYNKFLEEIKKTQLEFSAEMKGIYETLSPLKINKEIEESFHKITGKIIKTFKGEFHKTSNTFTETNKVFTRLIDDLHQINKSVSNHSKQVKEIYDNLKESETNYNNSLENLNDNQSDFIKNMQEIINQENLIKLNKELKLLIRLVEKIPDSKSLLFLAKLFKKNPW